MHTYYHTAMGAAGCAVAVSALVTLVSMFTPSTRLTTVDFLGSARQSSRVALILYIVAWLAAVNAHAYNVVAASFPTVGIVYLALYLIGLLASLIMGKHRDDQRKQVCASLSRSAVFYGVLYFIAGFLLQTL